jgi:hypothetical protein
VANDASHHAPLVHDAEPPRVGNRVEQRAGDPTFGTPLPPGPPETAPVAMEAKGFLGPELAQALFLEGNLKGSPREPFKVSNMDFLLLEAPPACYFLATQMVLQISAMFGSWDLAATFDFLWRLVAFYWAT